MHPESPTRRTAEDNTSATWSVVDGVIHVLSVQHPDGTEMHFPEPLMLGECLHRMPRALWERIRRDYYSGWHGGSSATR
jgi:hypothetical protein